MGDLQRPLVEGDDVIRVTGVRGDTTTGAAASSGGGGAGGACVEVVRSAREGLADGEDGMTVGR